MSPTLLQSCKNKEHPQHQQPLHFLSFIQKKNREGVESILKTFRKGVMGSFLWQIMIFNPIFLRIKHYLNLLNIDRVWLTFNDFILCYKHVSYICIENGFLVFSCSLYVKLYKLQFEVCHIALMFFSYCWPHSSYVWHTHSLMELSLLHLVIE